jgi:hypothetical protein
MECGRVQGYPWHTNANRWCLVSGRSSVRIRPPACHRSGGAQGIWWQQQYVLNRVAQRLDSGTMPFEVTDDFIVYAWDQDDEALEASIRFSARPEALAELERKGD